MNKDEFGRELCHDFQVRYITKHMDISDDFKVSTVCTHCKEEKTRHFVTQSECIRLGANPDELKNIKSSMGGVLGISYEAGELASVNNIR